MKKETVILLLISVFIVVLPFSKILNLGYYDSKRVYQLVLFCAIGISVGINLVTNNFKKVPVQYSGVPATLLILTLLFLFTGFISAFLSDSHKHAYLDLSLYTTTFFFAYLLVSIFKNQSREFIELILYLALLFAVIYSVFMFYNYIRTFFDELMPLWPNYYATLTNTDGQVYSISYPDKEVLYFSNIRFFNDIQGWTLPLLIGLYCYLAKTINRKSLAIFVLIIASIWWMLVFASASRAVFVSVLVGLLFINIYLKPDKLLFIKYTFISLIAGFLAYLALFTLHPSQQISITIFRSNYGRLKLWGKGLDGWLQQPIFGIGPYHYSKAGEVGDLAHPHNFLIQILSEWGIIAFILLAVTFIYVLLKFKESLQNHHLNKNYKMFGPIILWSFISGLGQSFFSGAMHTPVSLIWFSLIFACVLLFIVNYTIVDMNNVHFWVIYVVFIISCLSLVYFSYVTIFDITGIQSRLTFPRFWQQGLFK